MLIFPGFEGESNNHRLLYAWNDRIRAAQESEGKLHLGIKIHRSIFIGLIYVCSVAGVIISERGSCCDNVIREHSYSRQQVRTN